MKTIFFYICLLLCLALSGCGRDEPPAPSPVPEEGFVRQSYDIQGLLIEGGEARVWGLVLNTGTLDIAYIAFDVQLLDGSNNTLYVERYETTLYEAVVPGDSYPFNCVFPNIFEEDAETIAKVRIGELVWRP
ncbi:MAG: hypothetical protein Q4C13_02940 [Clostridia bacterium]|nr:hypothetical protein [Clostridia bacterium]